MQEDSYSTLSDLFSPSWWHLLLQVSSYTDADDGPGPWPWGVSGLDKLVSALERLEGPVAMQLLWKMLTFSISLTIIFITGVFVWVFNRQTQIRPSKSQNLHLKNKNINKNMPMTLESMGSCDSQEAQSQSPQRRKKRRNRNRSKKKKKTKKEDENENENENDSDDSVNVKNDEAAKEKRTDAEERAMSSSSKSKFNSIRSHDSNSNSIDDHWSHRMKKIISSNLDLQALERNETKNADTNAKERVEDQDQDPISPLKPPSASTSTSLTNHHKEVRHHLFKSIKRLKVFSYLSDEAFLESLAFMEWIHLKEEGRELFTEEGDADGNGNGNGNENENENENENGEDVHPFDGSLYVVIEGSMKIESGLPLGYGDDSSYGDGDNPIVISAGPGDVLTSLLSVLFGLVETYQTSNSSNGHDNEDGIPNISSTSKSQSQSQSHASTRRRVRARAYASSPNTRLIRVPPSAFAAMLKTHPHDVFQIAQVILARVQRVTIQSLVNHLGLGFEVLYNHGDAVDVNVNDTTSMDGMSGGVDVDSNTSNGDEEKMKELKAIAEQLSQGEGMQMRLEVALHSSGIHENSIEMLCNMVGKTLTSTSTNTNTNSSSTPAIEAENMFDATRLGMMEKIQSEAILVTLPPGEVVVEAETKAEYVHFVIDGALEVGAMLDDDNYDEKGMGSGMHGSISVNRNVKRNTRRTGKRNRNINREQDESSNFQRLYQVLPGDTIGQMSCFTDEVSFVTVRTCNRSGVDGQPKPTILLKIPKSTFASLADKNSDVLIQCVNKILTVDFSPLVHVLDWGVQWKHVEAGEVLAKDGEVCNHLHIILSGRLKSAMSVDRVVQKNQNDNDNDNEYGRGSCIGQALVLTGSEWPNDVFAIRNSELAIIPSNLLEYIMNMFPQTAVHFAKEIARNVQNPKRRKGTSAFSTIKKKGISSHELSMATIAVVPLCFKKASEATELCTTISSGMEKIAPCKLMTRSAARQSMGSKVFSTRNAALQMKMSRLFCDLEESSSLTVYQADYEYTWWTKLCIQQADYVLLVVNAKDAPKCEELEKYLSEAFEERMVQHVQVLVLQDVSCTNTATVGGMNTDQGCTSTKGEVRTQISKDLNEWLEERSWIEGQHLARMPLKAHDVDISRMCRRITGQSLGLALGGGGARGLAHIGVIRALMERNVTVDICGGTSQGAFIGALYSMSPDDYDQLVNEARVMAQNMSSIKRKLHDLTLPIVSYFNGSGFDQQIIESIGEDTKFSDLLLNYFCVSTDMSLSSPIIHTKGVCWKYVRASMSLCGYLPPVSEDGRLLVDGGYTCLVPGDIVKDQMNAKSVICCDVAKESSDEYYGYGTNLSGLWLLVNSLNPFETTVRVPSMGELSRKLIWVSANNRRDGLKDEADLFLSPPVKEYGTLQFDKFDEIVEKGYQYAKPRVDAFIRENPWVVSS